MPTNGNDRNNISSLRLMGKNLAKCRIRTVSKLEPSLKTRNFGAGVGTLPTISSPPYQAPHIKPPISGPPYEAPHIRPPISSPPYQTPHIKPPTISSPPYQALHLNMKPPTYHIKPLVLDVQNEPPTYDIKLFELNR